MNFREWEKYEESYEKPKKNQEEKNLETNKGRKTKQEI